MSARYHLLATGALLAWGVPAQAANLPLLPASPGPAAVNSSSEVNTLPSWNGTSFVSSWGAPNTATYGETITPTATQTRLGSFTFELAQTGGTAQQYQAFVYQWDPTNQHIVGSALYTSGVLTAPSGAAFSPVTINTGSVALTPGQQYVLFLTTSTISSQANGSYKWGAVTNITAARPLVREGQFLLFSNSTSLNGGQFVFFNNGTNFGQLSTGSWSSLPEDLAFMVQFNPFLSPMLPTGAPINQTNVAAGIDKAIAAGVTLPAGFNSLFELTPTQLIGALGALSGENATQAQQGAFELGNSYLSLLTDPFANDRVGAAPAMGFAPERQSSLPPSLASAFAMYTKAPLLAYQPRWDAWGAAFGGGSNSRGDSTVVGSNDSNTTVAGVAAGVDYRFAPGALIGFSLAGGHTNWSVLGSGFGNGGGGTSDAFMAGVYGKYTNGPAYLSGALTFSNYWMSTSRTVTVAGFDQLQANFNAQSWGGRLEGGYRLPNQTFMINWTPYAAIQAQSFYTPNYAESAVGGSNQFALNFNSRTATDYRGELGVRGDRLIAVDNGNQVNLFGKLAYAHDEITNPSASANFTTLGLGAAPFIVFGAAPSHDLALTTVGMEYRLASGWSFLAKFDGEFGDRSQTYSGTGRIRYTW